MNIYLLALRRHFLPTYIYLLIELLVNLNKPSFIMFTVPIYNAGKLIDFFFFFNLCSNNMDKSWMTKHKISKEDRDGYRQGRIQKNKWGGGGISLCIFFMGGPIYIFFLQENFIFLFIFLELGGTRAPPDPPFPPSLVVDHS
jgi:hypothetical protein